MPIPALRHTRRPRLPGTPIIAFVAFAAAVSITIALGAVRVVGGEIVAAVITYTDTTDDGTRQSWTLSITDDNVIVAGAGNGTISTLTGTLLDDHRSTLNQIADIGDHDTGCETATQLDYTVVYETGERSGTIRGCTPDDRALIDETIDELGALTEAVELDTTAGH